MATYRPGYGKIGRDYAMRMFTMRPEEDGPVWMVNFMKYKEVAAYTDDESQKISGKEADDLYSPVKILREIGAEVSFFGDVELQLAGDDVQWDRIGVVKYPTRKSFLDMQNRDDFKGKHEHKEAGMQFTFVIGCQPANISDSFRVQPDSWDSVEHTPTIEDGPVVVVHALKFVEGGREGSVAHIQLLPEVGYVFARQPLAVHLQVHIQ